MAAPFVSVVIPAYDRPDFLDRAVRSILEQTYRDYEIVVVDDGSEPPQFDRLDPGVRDAIRYRRKPRGGGASARNVGIRMARGSLIAFLDHDDRFLPEKLARHVAVMSSSDAVLSYCRVRRSRCGAVKDVRPDDGVSGWAFDALVEKSIVRGFSSVVVRKSALEEVELLDESYRIIDDYHLYFRLAQKGTFEFLPEVLVEAELHEGNTSNDRLALHLEYARLFSALSVAFKGKSRRKLCRKAAYHWRKSGDVWAARGNGRRALREYARGVATYPFSSTGFGRILTLPFRAAR